MDRDTTDPTQNGAVKDPADWTTGDEPMTGAQESYVHTLARQAGEEEEIPAEMTKAEASEKIEELRARTGKSGGAPKTTSRRAKRST